MQQKIKTHEQKTEPTNSSRTTVLHRNQNTVEKTPDANEQQQMPVNPGKKRPQDYTPEQWLSGGPLCSWEEFCAPKYDLPDLYCPRTPKKPAPRIQAKLMVSRPGDAAEQEAERIAGTIVGKEERAFVARKSDEKEDEDSIKIQRKEGDSGLQIDPGTEQEIEALGNGSPIGEAEREYFEKHFGTNFREVKIHDNSRAHRLAERVDARAFTRGSDIVFGRGEYTVNTEKGRTLVAHELVHVVQQRNNKSIGTSIIQKQDNEQNRTIVINDVQSIDREFWIIPPGLRPGAVPIYDDENTNVIIGFRYSHRGFWQIYDLEGNLVEQGEHGVEQPFIDPVDVISGLLVGFFKAGVSISARTAGRTATSLATRGVLQRISRSAIATLRAIYRSIRFRGPLNFTVRTTLRMSQPERRVPYHILQLAIRLGRRVPDPEGARGAFMYYIRMFRNGREFTLEVLFRETDNTILHFKYYHL